MCPAVRLDHALRIGTEARGYSSLQPGVVERKRLGRGPVVQRFFGSGISDQQWDGG
jgi:hypothetical protein